MLIPGHPPDNLMPLKALKATDISHDPSTLPCDVAAAKGTACSCKHGAAAVYFSSEQQPQTGRDGKLHWRHQEWKRQQMSATPNKAVLTMPGLQGMGWWQCAGGCLVRLPENAITRQEKAFWSQSWRGVFPGASFLASAVGDSC